MLSQSSYIEPMTRITTFVIRGELHGDERIEIFCASGEKFIPTPVLQSQLIEEEAQSLATYRINLHLF
jgi:hypothetical protein